MSAHVDATFYVQVTPDGRYWDAARQEYVPRSAKLAAATQKKPDRPKPGTVLVKLTVRVPVAAFLPLRPEAIVVIPEDIAVTTPIEVIAEDPS